MNAPVLDVWLSRRGHKKKATLLRWLRASVRLETEKARNMAALGLNQLAAESRAKVEAMKEAIRFKRTIYQK